MSINSQNVHVGGNTFLKVAKNINIIVQLERPSDMKLQCAI